MYKTLIGVEIHIELKTESKIFCSCSTKFGSRPNTQTCPICLGLPGTLPTLNKKVVKYAIMAGLSLNCDISQTLDMDRKNYCYPDLVKGFQTTQYFNPICRNGHIQIENKDIDKKIRITRIHIEEDTGKTIYDEHKNLYLDYNRSGIPLIEIVTEPDINSTKELELFLEKLKSIIEYTEISDCKMEQGSLRCDVNINIIDENTNKKTNITELKNLNSFKAIIKAVDYETTRHIELLKSGQVGDKETRKWDENKNKTSLMRKKQTTDDYRYFKEENISDIYIEKELIQHIKQTLPEFREQKIKRFIKEYDLPEYDASVLTSDKHLAIFFEQTNKYTNNPKVTSNFIMGDILRKLKHENMIISQINFTPKDLAELINIVINGEINNNTAKKVLKVMFTQNKTPKQIIKQLGLGQINDEEELNKIVIDILLKNQNSIEEYRNGKDRVIGFLVGQAMKQTKGQANPKKINEIILEMIKNS